VITGQITYQSPPVCTTPSGLAVLQVAVSVDGAYVGTVSVGDLQSPGGTATLPTSLYVFAPGSDTPHTLTAMVTSTCNEPFTITDLRLDLTGFT
jgi:hypothetical protein